MHLPLTCGPVLLFGDPIPEENHQLGADRVPVLPPARLFLCDVHRRRLDTFRYAVSSRRFLIGDSYPSSPPLSPIVIPVNNAGDQTEK